MVNLQHDTIESVSSTEDAAVQPSIPTTINETGNSTTPVKPAGTAHLTIPSTSKNVTTTAQQPTDVAPSDSTNDPGRIAEIPEACAPQNQPVSILSDRPLSECRVPYTIFKGCTGTLPVREVKDASWPEFQEDFCPPKPDILSDKKDGRFIVPCILRDAPLVGTTLDIAKYRGKPLFGKMRSKGHMTEAWVLLADCEGLSEAEFIACQALLKSAKITYVAFTTHSYGKPDKPGMRGRMAVPLNRAVTPDEYTTVWHGFVQVFFGGQLSKVDPSGAKLHQQQGTFCCHPTRIHLAESWSNNAGVASVDALIAIGRTVEPPAKPTMPQSEEEVTARSTFPVDKIIALLEHIDPDLLEPNWFRVLAAVFNGTGGSQAGLEIVDEWSSRGQKYRGIQDVQKRWRSFDPNHPHPVKIGTLVMMAKQAGADTDAILHGEFSEIIESEEAADESDPAALPETATLEPLPTIQLRFGLLNISGKLCVFARDVLNARTNQGTARRLLLSTRSDGALLVERAVRAAYPDADAQLVAKEFFVNPDTVCYRGVEFNPKGTSENYLNLWEGPTITPREGLWLLIQDFLYAIICDGDWDSYLYLIYFIAHALQKPEEKPGVMIILIGGQGIGKGTLGRVFQRIWSATYIQVNNVGEVVGTFNAILERAYIVFLDEALFAGNRRGTDELKSIVTEPIIQISEKYQPSRQIRSVHRFVAATNADHFKNTERDDRRDFTLRVSEVRKGDLDYWTVLNDEIENGGVEAMVHDLLLVDLSGFNVRSKPNTKELVEQKIHSLDPIMRWWHDGLYNGTFGNGDNWPGFISTQDAIDGIIEVNGGRMHKKPSALIIAQALHKICPSAKQHQQQERYDRHRGYLLPSLQQARAEFALYIGGVVEWPERNCTEIECSVIEPSEVEPASHAPLGDNLAPRAADF